MSEQSQPSRLRKAALLALALLTVLGLAVLIPVLVGQAKLNSALESWTASGMDLDEFVAERPAREANGAALEVERLAAAVGIDMVPKQGGRKRDAPAEPKVRAELEAARSAATELLKRLLEDEGVAPPPEVPESLTAWFETHATGWAALRGQLATGVAPAWERRVDRGMAAPIPNLLGYVKVSRLLHANAYIAASKGRQAEAREALEASWTLSESLRERDVLIGYLIRIHLAQQQAGLVRRLPGLDEEAWAARLQLRSLNAEAGEALRGEASGLATSLSTAALRREFVGAESGLLGSAAGLVLGPGAAGTQIRSLHVVAEALAAEPNCPAVDAAVAASASADKAWNPLAKILSMDNSRALARAFSAQVQDELSAKVLQARAAGGVVDAPWRHSRCEQLSYQLTPLPEGGYRISIVGEVASDMLARQHSQGPRYALAHVEPAS